MSSYNQQQQTPQQRMNQYHMSTNQNPTSVYQYAQLQQQMAQKQQMQQMRNPSIQGAQLMYMQQRNLTPDQYAYQQRLQQQVQMQQMQSQKVQPYYLQQSSVTKNPAEQRVQQLEVPEHYYETQLQREERECNSSPYYHYNVMNDIKKIIEKGGGVVSWM